MKKKTLKKIIALALAGIMLTGSIPTNTFASQASELNEKTEVVESQENTSMENALQDKDSLGNSILDNDQNNIEEDENEQEKTKQEEDTELIKDGSTSEENVNTESLDSNKGSFTESNENSSESMTEISPVSETTETDVSTQTTEREATIKSAEVYSDEFRFAYYADCYDQQLIVGQKIELGFCDYVEDRYNGYTSIAIDQMEVKSSDSSVLTVNFLKNKKYESNPVIGNNYYEFYALKEGKVVITINYSFQCDGQTKTGNESFNIDVKNNYYRLDISPTDKYVETWETNQLLINDINTWDVRVQKSYFNNDTNSIEWVYIKDYDFIVSVYFRDDDEEDKKDSDNVKVTFDKINQQMIVQGVQEGICTISCDIKVDGKNVEYSDNNYDCTSCTYEVCSEFFQLMHNQSVYDISGEGDYIEDYCVRTGWKKTILFQLKRYYYDSSEGKRKTEIIENPSLESELINNRAEEDYSDNPQKAANLEFNKNSLIVEGLKPGKVLINLRYLKNGIEVFKESVRIQIWRESKVGFAKGTKDETILDNM